MRTAYAGAKRARELFLNELRDALRAVAAGDLSRGSAVARAALLPNPRISTGTYGGVVTDGRPWCALIDGERLRAMPRAGSSEPGRVRTFKTADAAYRAAARVLARAAKEGVAGADAA